MIFKITGYLFLQFPNHSISDRDNVLQMVTGSLEMVQCLKRIAQFYFTEAQIGSRNVGVMIEVDFQFNSGCDAVTEVLYAVKNKILNNSCFCLTNDKYCT